jgi:hypothetical protein
MSDHPLNKVISSFDLQSYYAGITMAFAEVVGAGCKKLALSSPYSREMAEKMLPASEVAAKEYNVRLLVEPNLLVTKLFPRDVAKDKTVILIAHDQSVLNEYAELKRLREKSDKEGNPVKLEIEIAKRFGVLLSYDNETVNRLLAAHG